MISVFADNEAALATRAIRGNVPCHAGWGPRGLRRLGCAPCIRAVFVCDARLFGGGLGCVSNFVYDFGSRGLSSR